METTLMAPLSRTNRDGTLVFNYRSYRHSAPGSSPRARSHDGRVRDGAHLAQHVGRQRHQDGVGDRRAEGDRDRSVEVTAGGEPRVDEHGQHRHRGVGCCACDGHRPSLLIHLEHTSHQTVTGTAVPLVSTRSRSRAVSLRPLMPLEGPAPRRAYGQDAARRCHQTRHHRAGRT